MSKEKDILIKLADFVRKRAKAKYKSNLEFANVCNVDESTIRRVLQGKQNISIKLLDRIADGLDLKPSEILKELGR